MIRSAMFLLVAVCSTATLANDDSNYDVNCARRCSQRSINGTCRSFTADYCAMGDGIACVPRCVQRNIYGRCSNYALDFCGNYPQCVPHCVQPSIHGKCLNYGNDQCYAENIGPWPLGSDAADFIE